MPILKRLRLENAAVHLRTTGLTVTDIAFKSGYETPAAFAKAFRERFGIAPTGFRTRNGKSSGGIQSTQTSEEIMKQEIRTLHDQKVLFVRRTGNYGQAAEEAMEDVDEAFVLAHDDKPNGSIHRHFTRRSEIDG